MTSAYELAQLDDDELENRLAEYRRELLNLRFQLATSQLDNYSRMSTARRDVARILTLMREREIALAEGREAGPVIPRVRPVRRRPRSAEDLEAEGIEPDDLEAEGAEDLDAEATGDLEAGELDENQDLGGDDAFDETAETEDSEEEDG